MIAGDSYQWPDDGPANQTDYCNLEGREWCFDGRAPSIGGQGFNARCAPRPAPRTRRLITVAYVLRDLEIHCY